MPPDAESDEIQQAVAAAQNQFVIEWGRMSSSWGINRTMAQIHALLLVTGQPHSVDEIIDRLHISRGNASMTLRDLVDWGVIKRLRKPGDRKDIYQSDSDILHMFARVVRERKRREIDPTISAIRDCLEMVPSDAESEDAVVLRERLVALLEVFDLIDRVYSQVFQSDATFRDAVRALASSESGPRREGD